MATGMLIDGIAASEAIDSSGEVLSIEGCDISTLDTEGVLNWEHKNEDDPTHTASDIVGKIVFAKKIFTAKDCDNDRQLYYWNKVELPFIYIIGRLYDGAGHQAASDMAAQIRDHLANGEPILVRFSIEGSTMRTTDDKKGLLESVARRVACTIKPCNRSCNTGVIADPNAPAGFDKAPGKNVDKDFLDEVLKRSEHPHPNFTPLGGRTVVECDPVLKAEALESALQKFESVKKTLAAGNYNVSPGMLVGGSALQVEDPSLKLRAKVRKAMSKWDTKSDLKAYLKAEVPEASDEYVNRFADLVEKYKVGKKGSLLKMGNFQARNITEMEKHESLIRKLEALTIELKKNAQPQAKPKADVNFPDVDFKGKKVKPGVAHLGDKRLALLHADDDHLIGVPDNKIWNWSPDDIVKLPRRAESVKYQVIRYPTRLEDPSVVDAKVHGSPFNREKGQAEMVHGLDLGKKGRSNITVSREEGRFADKGINENRSAWHQGPKGHVYVKEAGIEGQFNDVHRELAYHNIAKDFFGLGEHLPTVAHIKHPQTGRDHAVVEKVPGDHVPRKVSVMGGKKAWVPLREDDGHALMSLGESGKLDKLAMMNAIMGNSDRHAFNWMLDKDKNIKLIDHGHAFFRMSDSPAPDYWHLWHAMKAEKRGERPNSWINETMHPDAIKWVQGLDGNKLAEQLRAHGAPDSVIRASTHRLQAIQQALQDPKAPKWKVWFGAQSLPEEQVQQAAQAPTKEGA